MRNRYKDKPKNPELITQIKLPGYQCSRCGHTWAPRFDKIPKVCPNPSCKSPYWDRPRSRYFDKS